MDLLTCTAGLYFWRFLTHNTWIRMISRSPSVRLKWVYTGLTLQTRNHLQQNPLLPPRQPLLPLQQVFNLCILDPGLLRQAIRLERVPLQGASKLRERGLRSLRLFNAAWYACKTETEYLRTWDWRIRGYTGSQQAHQWRKTSTIEPLCRDHQTAKGFTC